MIAVVSAVLYLDWWSAEITGPQPVVGIPLGIIFLVLVAMGFVEIVRLGIVNGVLILVLSGLIGAAMLGSTPLWWEFIETHRGPEGSDVLVVLGLIVMGVFLEQMIRYRTIDAFRRIACTLLAVLYLGVGGAMVFQIRLSYGIPMLVVFLVIVKFTDIGAYFTGSFVGKHKLIPWLSPGKTWEGLVGGLVVGTGMGLLGMRLLRIEQIALWEGLVFGVVVGLVGQFADLCESLLKRSGKIKDSGAVVPEFGGVLDIIDSVLLSAPVAFLLLGLIA